MSPVDAYAAARAAVTEMFGLVESDDQACCLAHVLQFSRDGKPRRMRTLPVSQLTSFNLQQTPTGFTFETHLEQDHFPEAFPRFMDLIGSRTSRESRRLICIRLPLRPSPRAGLCPYRSPPSPFWQSRLPMLGAS